eukprot:COSAG02_NODE_205_length_29157_cov_13.424771_15_plen_170_part_00
MRDAARNEIQTNIQVKKVSYHDFLREYDPHFLHSNIREEPMQEPELEPESTKDLAAAHDDGADADDGSAMARHSDVAQTDVDARDGENDLTDRERRMQTELMKARAELQQLRAHSIKAKLQVVASEGVPPTNALSHDSELCCSTDESVTHSQLQSELKDKELVANQRNC